MNKELKYNGYSANPSDHESADGDLATAMGLVQEDGTLKPILPPSEVLELQDGASVVYIHETSIFKHYIVKKDLYMYWITENGDPLSESNKIGSTQYGIENVNAVGNTLIICSANNIEYYLWTSNTYKSLGTHIPNIEISFGLHGKPLKEGFSITFDAISESVIERKWTEANQDKITEQVMAKVNKFLADQTIDKGRFALPFFVRYALRLYDGSLVGHSAPILMNPSTNAAPIVYWSRTAGESSYSQADCEIMLVSAGIDYQLRDDSDSDYISLQESWSDIIKSIDVFISKPIYPYDQSGKCTSFANTSNLETKFIGALESKIWLPITLNGEELEGIESEGIYDNKLADAGTAFNNKYAEWSYSMLYALYFPQHRIDPGYDGNPHDGPSVNPEVIVEGRQYPELYVTLPECSSDSDSNDELLNKEFLFYFLTSLKIEDLSTSTRNDIDVPDDYLQSLVNREVMTDDYLTHDKLSADYTYMYNSRLNLMGVKRELFRGFTADSMLSYFNAHFAEWSINDKKIEFSFANPSTIRMYIDVYIKENGETYKVTSESCGNNSYTGHFLSQSFNAGISKMSWGCYVFYPNVNAFKIVFRDASNRSYEIDLKAHDFLNGAYGVLDYELQRSTNASAPSVTQCENIIDVSNKIYTSEVNNPFYFPVLGINTVGTGKIIGISSAAKALSEGQFGQFPLYAFTSEGVWALEVSSTGSYSAKQPITRDVCINTNSITQIDSAVLFVTDRGIMLISGSTVTCISESLNTADIFTIADLPKSDKLVEIYNSKADDDSQLTLDDLTLLPFKEFISECRMIYDYYNQHIIVYNPNARYAYVYSLKSKVWGMCLSNITYGVNSYPEALAMTSDSKLVDFSHSSANGVTALIVTRPIILDDPNIMKTIETIIQRGLFASNHVSQVLYGSNDLYNWQVVWSSVDKYMRGFRGTPYKAFRLAIVCDFGKSESLWGCSIQYSPRMLNNLR